jgi:hypothetical protein
MVDTASTRRNASPDEFWNEIQAQFDSLRAVVK